MSCGLGRRYSSDLALLWLWHRLAATAPIRPLAWELPYTTSAALKRQKTKKKNLACCCCSIGHNCNCSWDLIPGLGNPYAAEQPKKKKKIKNKNDSKMCRLVNGHLLLRKSEEGKCGGKKTFWNKFFLEHAHCTSKRCRGDN